jgi:peroxidase
MELQYLQVGGTPWIVALGRRDTTTVDGSAPIKFLPSPSENLTAIVAKFAAVGLSLKDTVVLSGTLYS